VCSQNAKSVVTALMGVALEYRGRKARTTGKGNDPPAHSSTKTKPTLMREGGLEIISWL
jgi:hypothetical protein